MKARVVAALLICPALAAACDRRRPAAGPEALHVSAWVEDAAIKRGHIKAGDVAQFGCPPGWMGVDDSAVALRGAPPSMTYRGSSAPPRDGTVTCVAQGDFALPPPYPSAGSERDATHRPLTPVWLKVAPDSTTIVFGRDLPLSAALYVGQDTPCGPRLLGVRLGDLLKWLSDPPSATTRDFLGLISAGCPEQLALMRQKSRR